MAYDLDSLDQDVSQNSKAIYINPKKINFFLKKRSEILEKKISSKFKELNLHKNNILLAVGGFGRQEIFPNSDLDLSILRVSLSKNDEQKIQKFISWMWDEGLNPGASVRTFNEAIKISKKDISEYTNYLSQRPISINQAHEAIFEKFCKKQKNCLSSKSFFLQKFDEQYLRYKKFDSTAFNLEPNIKESPGGLRDFHMMIWLENVFGKDVLQNFLSQHISTFEQKEIERSFDRLKALRYLLHLECNQDRLSFENQIKIQKKLFPSKNTNSAVEKLMRNYYLDATHIHQLNELLSSFGSKFSFFDPNVDKNIPPQEQVLKAFIQLGQQRQKQKFSLAQFSNLKKLVTEYPDKSFQNKRIASLFMDFLKSPFQMSSLLRIMRQIGLLQKIVPEFKNVIGMMQFDLFHAFTVDEHTFKVVKNMRQMFIGNAPEDLNLEKELIRKLPNIEILYLAGLFHDINKGKKGDHSELGANAAMRFSLKASMEESEADLVSWLVKEHLTMSSWSQKMDVHDHQTIIDFSKKIGSINKLNYLYILTINDMRGTNPTLWNSWKHGLLKTLYLETRKVLNQLIEKNPKKLERILPNNILKSLEFDQRHLIENKWNELPHSYFSRYSIDTILSDTRLLGSFNTESYKSTIEKMTDYYLLTVYGPNRQGLFHRIVEIMGKINLEVFDADIMTAASNTFVLNKFVVKHKMLGNKLNKDDVDRMIKVLDQNLDQFERPLEINKSFLENKSKIFNFKNNVTITGVKNTQRKRITIETLDKPGLLIKISKIFLENAIQIHAARITTLGEKVEDTFLISSSKKDKLLDEDVIKRLSVSLQNL